MKISDQIKKGESKFQELKEFFPKNESIAKTAIAFANTGGGKLIIGVNDNLEIVGIDDNEIFKLQDKIASIVSDSCSLSIIPGIYNLNIDNKLLLVIEIPRGNQKPYFLKSKGKTDGTYIRIGATNRQAQPETIAELERQRLHISFDEEIFYGTTLSELDLKPLSDKFLTVGKRLDNLKLENLKLISRKTENYIQPML